MMFTFVLQGHHAYKHNKRMLHQPLRGMDGFSDRVSLQNRRKC